MSPGVYRKLMGNIFAVGGAVRIDALKESMPRPFVVVHSGKTTTARFGCSFRRVRKSVSFESGCDSYCGARKARRRAWNSEIRWTSRVEG